MEVGFRGVQVGLLPHLDHFPAVWPQRTGDDNDRNYDFSHILSTYYVKYFISLTPQNNHVKFTLLTKLLPHRYCPLPLAWDVCDLGRSLPLWIQASELLPLLQGVLALHWRRTMLTLNSAHLLLSRQDLPLTELFLDTGTRAKHLTHTFLTLIALFSVLNTVKMRLRRGKRFSIWQCRMVRK